MRCFGVQLARRATGFALLAGAVGCGGRVTGEEADSEAAPAPRTPPPYATVPPPRSTPPAVSAPAVPRPMMPPAPPVPPQPQFAEALAENVLAANCGSCHGPALTFEQAMARINYIDDIDRLVEVGLIVPLNAAASRIVQLMLDGSMPPAASGYPPVTDADIAIVVAYIDNARYWPGFSPPPVLDVDAGAPTAAVDAGAGGG